mgnify:CR=1 FL=1
MERLTERDDKGNLLFNGKQVYAGDFYEAVSCLEEYEDTGLDPEQIVELKERDTAKAPTKVSDSGVRYTDDYICPNCGKHFTGTGIAEFCYHCGQRLKWEE